MRAILPVRRVRTDQPHIDFIHKSRRLQCVAGFTLQLVCSRSGAVYFSEVDPASGTGISEDPDILDSETLARLFRFAGVKLTVIGSCDSMALAVTLTTVCHVVAAKDMVSATMMAAWVEAFYRALPKSSLSQALSDADDLSRAPMRFYGRQVAPANVFFKPTLVGAKATA